MSTLLRCDCLSCPCAMLRPSQCCASVLRAFTREAHARMQMAEITEYCMLVLLSVVS